MGREPAGRHDARQCVLAPHALHRAAVGTANLKQWKTEKRDVNADYKKLFADENEGKVSAVTAVGIGADSDNTKGHSVGYVANIVLEP